MFIENSEINGGMSFSLDTRKEMTRDRKRKGNLEE
jgi:hypothetical protein